MRQALLEYWVGHGWGDGNLQTALAHAAGGKLASYVTAELGSSLSRFERWLTRVEVHLSVEAAGRIDDKRCVIEARPAGAQSVAVTHHAGSVDEAYNGAALKLEKVLDTKYSRAHDHKGGDTIRHMESIDDSN